MADFNSKYTGEQVEALLDIVSQGGSGGGEGGEVQKTTEAEITAMGFTKNLGTITEVKMNGVSKGTSGVVDLGTVLTEHQDISGKQDKINDLEDIREGASKGATALQSVPSEYVTETELSNKSYATTAQLDNKVDKVSGKQLSTEDFTTALKTKLQGLINYDDTAISDAVASLQAQINTLVSGNASSAIESFNEIIAFLDGVKDTQDLSSIIAGIEQQIAGKQATISDLDTIRAGAAKGATALQSYTEKYTGTITGIKMNGANKGTSGVVDLGTVITSHQDISGKADKSSLAIVATSGSYNDLSNKPTIPSAVTESTVSGWGFTKNAGTVTGIKMNGTTYSPSNGVVNLGTISGSSSSGSGSSYAGNYPISELYTLSTVSLTPNTFTILKYMFTSTVLSLTLSTPSNNSIVNEYIAAWYNDSNYSSISIPSSIKWANDDVLVLEKGYTYILSIVNNIAVYLKVEGNIFNTTGAPTGSGGGDN